MTFAVILIITFVAAVALADAIRKAPWLFYGVAVLAVALLLAGVCGLLEGGWWKPLILLVKRCMVALALFVVVMFAGAFGGDSKLGTRLRSARSELSIIACILCAGHVCLYVVPYSARALSGTLQNAMVVSFAVAMVLIVLLVLLGVTSLGFVKKRMKTSSWKRIQRLAYAFFLLTYVHLVLMLAPAALDGGVSAIVGVAVYSLVFAAYAVLRYRRKRLDEAQGVRADGVASG